MTPDWLEFDRRHIWHPYTSAEGDEMLPVTDAQGVRIRLADGRELIDGMSSWWSVIHGYRHPVIDQAIREQLERMSHVMFGGLTHEPAVRLAQRLIELTPAPLERVFFADSGSVAVEVALKMALQYWMGRGRPEKSRLMTVRYGYHGDTFGAMSVCDPDNGMHGLFRDTLAPQFFVDAPSAAGVDDESDLLALEQALEQHGARTAAFIIEPLVQGAGGMRFYRSDYLRRAAALCKEHQVLLILDEIATGFGRTGTMFACEQAGVEPDLMCLGKALTGGYMTLAATLCTTEVAQGISASEAGVLMHGPTFMANPLACAAANASLQVLEDSDWASRVKGIEQGLQSGLEPCRASPDVLDVRVKGAIGVLQLRDPSRLPAIAQAVIKQGVWLRPFRDLVYTMPPYVIEPDDLATITSAMAGALR